MKKTVLSILLLSISFVGFSQQRNQVLVTINDEEVTVNEFKRIYEKNLDAISDDKAKDVKTNLDLYINYKLKVANAYEEQLDTLPSYNREIETYRNQLIEPYLQDTIFLKKLMKETYFRMVNEIKASHILIRVSEKSAPKDTLIAYNKIIDARTKILNGASFDSIAKMVSEDPSAKTNGGDLGYFGAFKMVYPFEDAAYKTPVGEISMPFRSRFGYHIVKSEAIRKSSGEVEVAHIFLNDASQNSKLKIDSIYNKLNSGASFGALAKQYSKDSGSKDKGGKLQKFGKGRMVKPFEDVAFSIENEGEYSSPLKTRYGWHIIKLIAKHPVKSFEAMEAEINNQLRRSGRAKLSDEAVINRLKNEYTITEDEDAKSILKQSNIRSLPKDSLQKILLTINDKKITQEDFVNYTRNRRQFTMTKLFEMFINEEVKTYFKENLIYTEPEYAATLKEYEDGLLLFELMQQKIWKKSSNDSIALQNYYEKNQQWYDSYSLEPVKGQVINDFQNHLDAQWISKLRSENTIKINNKALRKLIAFYENEK